MECNLEAEGFYDKSRFSQMTQDFAVDPEGEAFHVRVYTWEGEKKEGRGLEGTIALKECVKDGGGKSSSRSLRLIVYLPSIHYVEPATGVLLLLLLHVHIFLCIKSLLAYTVTPCEIWRSETPPASHSRTPSAGAS